MEITREDKLLCQVALMTSELARKYADDLNKSLEFEGREGDISVGRITADISETDHYNAIWFKASALLLGKIEVNLPFIFTANRHDTQPKIRVQPSANEVFMMLIKSGKYPLKEVQNGD
jgi:hypothetical protein